MLHERNYRPRCKTPYRLAGFAVPRRGRTLSVTSKGISIASKLAEWIPRATPCVAQYWRFHDCQYNRGVYPRYYIDNLLHLGSFRSLQQTEGN